MATKPDYSALDAFLALVLTKATAKIEEKRANWPEQAGPFLDEALRILQETLAAMTPAAVDAAFAALKAVIVAQHGPTSHDDVDLA